MNNILVGVTGGISAYKAASIVSELKKKGYDVKVVMTENATKIISPLTFETLSRNRVYVDMWDDKFHFEVEHIELAKWADLILVAPATYNIIGKIANGIADDMLTTVVSATQAPLFFALAMNDIMYEKPILRENIKKLKAYNYHFIEADEGVLACNTIGKGRLKNETDIVSILERFILAQKIMKSFKGKKILITAGGTVEPIDPVRSLTNRSTGYMGYCLADAAIALEGTTTLVSAPTKLKVPNGLEKFISVGTAAQMYEAVEKEFDDCDIFISCAAVADYRPKNYSDIKIKKGEGDLVIEFERNLDILKEMSLKKKNQILVGYAAESNNVEENAIKKLKNKNLNLIVANHTDNMSKLTNSVIILREDGYRKEIENKEKMLIAFDVLSEIFNYIKK